jgi:DNA-binding MarR family transcriptional regulator
MPTLQSSYDTCLFHAASALGRSLARLADEHFKPLEITSTMGFILMSAQTAPGILINDLALVHHLDISTISRALDKLAALEMIQREGSHKNIRVFVTPKGARKEADARGAWNKLRQTYGLILTDPGALDLAGRVAKADAQLREAQRPIAERVGKRKPRS